MSPEAFDTPHGEVETYMAGCRCDECNVVALDALAGRRGRKAPPPSPVESGAEYVERLTRAVAQAETERALRAEAEARHATEVARLQTELRAYARSTMIGGPPEPDGLNTLRAKLREARVELETLKADRERAVADARKAGRKEGLEERRTTVQAELRRARRMKTLSDRRVRDAAVAVREMRADARAQVAAERARARAAEREAALWRRRAERAAKVEPVADRLAHWARINGFDADDPIELLRAAAAFRAAAEKAAARGVLTPYARMAHGTVDGWEQGCRCYGCAVAWKQAGKIV